MASVKGKAARSCLNCAFASWSRTKTGRLHPAGDGRCTWKMPEITLPKSMYWLFNEPNPCGGYIERSSPHTDCPAWRSMEGDRKQETAG